MATEDPSWHYNEVCDKKKYAFISIYLDLYF